MATEIVSEVIGGGPRSGSGAAARPVISQTVQAGSLTRSADKPERSEDGRGGDGHAIENIVRPGGGRVLSESTRKMLDNLDKHGTVTEPKAPAAADAGVRAIAESTTTAAGAATTPATAAAATASTSAAPTAAAAAATAEAPVAAAAPPAAGEVDRLTSRNRELVTENERLKRGGARREPTPREKALDEIERGYLDNSTDAVRRLVALAIGADDPKHADVDAEMRHLLQDLTARELGVSVDTSQQAIKEAARTRLLLAREQRERKASQDSVGTAPENPEDAQSAQHAQLIGNLLSTKPSDGQSLAERYPMTMTMAQHVHGLSPNDLLLRVIRRGFDTGEFDRNDHDDKLVEAALKKTETLYQALGDQFAKARPQPSTAAPSSTATETANNGKGQGQAARSITNANASVAPATPPAKPETPAPAQPKKYRNEDDRRRAIIEGHIKD